MNPIITAVRLQQFGFCTGKARCSDTRFGFESACTPISLLSSELAFPSLTYFSGVIF
jgi:hypothetical protein